MEERAALKEWELAIRALAEGTQIVLLRKGGIVEETGEFDVVSPHFLLYPDDNSMPMNDNIFLNLQGLKHLL